MGDHRMNIEIKASFHGIKKEADMWINYSPTDCCGMDRRVIDFFEELSSEGYGKYDDLMEKVHKKAREDEERMELARLKEKYPELPTPPTEE